MKRRRKKKKVNFKETDPHRRRPCQVIFDDQIVMVVDSDDEKGPKGEKSKLVFVIAMK